MSFDDARYAMKDDLQVTKRDSFCRLNENRRGTAVFLVFENESSNTLPGRQPQTSRTNEMVAIAIHGLPAPVS